MAGRRAGHQSPHGAWTGPPDKPGDDVLGDRADDVLGDRADDVLGDRADDVLSDRADDVLDDRADDVLDDRADDVLGDRAARSINSAIALPRQKVLGLSHDVRQRTIRER